MTRLGTIKGTGQVLSGDEMLGEAEYSISVYESRNLKEARGHISADDDLLWAIFQLDGHATLRLEDGGSIDFLITNMAIGVGPAEIQVSGEVPGF